MWALGRLAPLACLVVGSLSLPTPEDSLVDSTYISDTDATYISDNDATYVSDGQDNILQITVAQAAEYGLTCLQASQLVDEAKVIIEQTIGDDGAAAAAAAGGVDASAAAGSGSVAAAAAGAGGSAAAAAAGDGAASSAAAVEGAAASAAAVEGAAASAAAGEGAAASAAAGEGAAASAAAGEGAAASAAAGEGAAASAAAGEGAAASSAAGEGAAASSAAGEEAAASAAAGEGAAASAAAAEGGGGASSGAGDQSGGAGGQDCECVPYYLCKDDEIITDGAGLIDIRFNSGENEESLANSQCANFLDVCCGAPLDKPDPDVIEDLLEEYYPTCGHRNPEGISVVIEGFKESESQFGEFPWMAIITEEEVQVNDGSVIQRFVCGASLIKTNVILTASHCVKGKTVSNLRVRLGEWDTKHEKEIFPYEQFSVASMVVHEDFNDKTLFNDVALLFLEGSVELKSHIDTVCLPAPDEQFDGEGCVATGFGKDKFHGGQYQNIMKQVDLEVVEHAQCQMKLRTTRLGRWFRLHDTFTCAGGEQDVDTCKGDGGSPLVCPRKDDPSKYVQVGIVAWGIGCGEGGIPGVYASIPKLVPWINEKIALNSLPGNDPY